MNRSRRKQRIFASLLILGAGVLLFRTTKMVWDGALLTLMPWVSALLIAEFLIDLGCLAASTRWCLAGEGKYASLPLRLGAAAAILHAFRVFIYVMGRIGPWPGFDIRPELRIRQAANYSQGWLIFAAIMSILGIAGVVIIYLHRRKRLSANRQEPQE